MQDILNSATFMIQLKIIFGKINPKQKAKEKLL